MIAGMAALKKVLKNEPELLASLGLAGGSLALNPEITGDDPFDNKLYSDETSDYAASAALAGAGGGLLGGSLSELHKRAPKGRRALIASLLGLTGAGFGGGVGYGVGKLIEED